MPRLDPHRWQLASPHLDHALDLDEHDRAVWLASLSVRDASLAADVEALLKEHRAVCHERFLEHPAAPTLAVLETAAGATLGAYTLLSPIGRGGMGTVWLAERSDGRFDRRAAIKLLNIALGGRGEDRFRREGRILARLAHPNISQLLDAGVSAAGQPYLVLEHVDGVPIDQYCDDRALDVPARLRLFLDVLEAVAHAHALLIVHRDIKPSNVLVTNDGQVKLLDFGIATLLEDDGGTALLTLDGATALTPAYAAPEQVTGQPTATATDVYTLGVLLYVLLTGRHPAGDRLHSAADLLKAIVETDPPRPSDVVTTGTSDAAFSQSVATRRATSPDKLRRLLRGDLDTIVGSALKKSPAERYQSVTALADDVRRYLRHEPIGARPDSFVYRGAKFVRRNRLVVAAALAVVVSLSIGLYTANRQRLLAERRFGQVRELANKLFDIDVAVRDLPGGVAARQLIVDTALDYLGRLAGDAQGDPDLALDVGTAYLRVARVQGIPISPNLGQLDPADRTLQSAKVLIDSVLAARPDHRLAFVRQAQIAHDRMILAGLRRPDDDAIAFARESARWLDRYLATGGVDASEAAQVAIVLSNVGNRFRIEGQFDEAIRLTQRGVEIAQTMPSAERQLGGLYIALGRIQRNRGTLEDALETYRTAVRTLDPAGRPPAQRATYVRTFALALVDQAETLGVDPGPNLGRPGDAIAHLEQAFATMDPVAHQAAGDANSRSMLSTAGIPLADLTRRTDAGRALDIYDHVLRHLGEIANNTRFRRDEVRALAGSARALQQMGRLAEAGQRLDAAFARLRDLRLFPAETIEVGTEPQVALVVLAEQQLAMNDTSSALATARSLIDGVADSESAARRHLDDAAALSHLYVLLANIQRRGGQPADARALDARRLNVWQHWDRVLPNNPFVTAQLAVVPPS
jgi:serine/threonine-protein kinase